MAVKSFTGHAIRNYWGIALAYALIIVRLYPQLDVPRMFNEDATSHAMAAMEHSWLKALLTPLNGYYSFLNNLVIATIVKLTPITAWPAWINAACLLLLLPCFAIPYASASPLWQGNLRRNIIPPVIALVGLRLVYNNGWLNMVNFQWFLCMGTLMILFSDAQSRKAAQFRTAFIAVASITGIVSVLLTPFYILKTLYYRSRNHPAFRDTALLAALLVLGACIEAAVIANILNHHKIHARTTGITFMNYLGYLSNRGILQPLLSTHTLRAVLPSIHPGQYLPIILASFAVLCWLATPLERLLLGIIFYLHTFVFLTCVGDKGAYIHSIIANGHYQVVQATILTLLLMQALHRHAARYAHPALPVLALLAPLLPSLADYTRHYPLNYGTSPLSWKTDAQAVMARGYGEIAIWPSGNTIPYCDPALCNPQTAHPVQSRITINRLPLPIHTPDMRYMRLNLQKPATVELRMDQLGEGEGSLLLRLDAYLYAPSTLYVTCTTPTQDKAAFTYALRPRHNSFFLHFPTLDRAHSSCTAGLYGIPYKIRLRAYY